MLNFVKSDKWTEAEMDLASELGIEFLEAAANGDSWAMKEIGDRIDGKPKQATEISGPNGQPIQNVEWTILPVAPLEQVERSD